jgi:hypothetical protein
VPPRIRRLALTVHVALAVGWLGAIGAYLALDLVAAFGEDPQALRAAYAGMDLIARRVLVPVALAAFATGVVMAIGTPWGLFRHYWVLISLLLTGVAAGVLLVETRVIRALATAATDPATSVEGLQGLGGTLAHSVGGLVVLWMVLVLNMYKPRGLTRYGWRKQHASPPGARKGGWRLTW